RRHASNKLTRSAEEHRRKSEPCSRRQPRRSKFALPRGREGTQKAQEVQESTRFLVPLVLLVFRFSLLLIWRRSATRSGRGASLATALSAPEIRLQQMCQCVDVAQLAILHPEEMSIGRTAAPLRVSRAEGAERHDGTDGRVHHESAVGDV